MSSIRECRLSEEGNSSTKQPPSGKRTRTRHLKTQDGIKVDKKVGFLSWCEMQFFFKKLVTVEISGKWYLYSRISLTIKLVMNGCNFFSSKLAYRTITPFHTLYFEMYFMNSVNLSEGTGLLSCIFSFLSSCLLPTFMPIAIFCLYSLSSLSACNSAFTRSFSFSVSNLSLRLWAAASRSA